MSCEQFRFYEAQFWHTFLQHSCGVPLSPVRLCHGALLHFNLWASKQRNPIITRRQLKWMTTWKMTLPVIVFALFKRAKKIQPPLRMRDDRQTTFFFKLGTGLRGESLTERFFASWLRIFLILLVAFYCFWVQLLNSVSGLIFPGCWKIVQQLDEERHFLRNCNVKCWQIIHGEGRTLVWWQERKNIWRRSELSSVPEGRTVQTIFAKHYFQLQFGNSCWIEHLSQKR